MGFQEDVAELQFKLPSDSKEWRFLASRGSVALGSCAAEGDIQQAPFGLHYVGLNGRKAGMGKIVKLIDDLVVVLKKEQNDDNDKREYCNEQFDQADDKKKGLERTIADVETVIAESTEGVATLAEELKALKAGIVAVDKQVVEATEQRKEEDAAHKELMQSNTAAK